MRRTNWRTAGAAAALVVVLLAAACGDDPQPAGSSNNTGQALIDAAKSEGELTWYTTIPPEMSELVGDLFEEKYGIPVTVLHLTGAAMLERFSAEQAAKVRSADVFDLSQPAIFEDQPQYFVEVDSAQVPSWADYPEAGKHGNYAVVLIQPNVIQYNPDLVPEDKVPSSWEDMTDPFWKGHILLTDPRSTTTYMGWAAEMEELYGLPYLEQLAAQDFKLVNSATPGAQQVAAGAAYANFPALEGNASALIRQGAPIEVVLMQEGQVGPPIQTGIVANAPHPNAAHLFYDFYLSPETISAICAESDISTMYSPDQVEGCVPLPSSWHLLDFDVFNDKEHSTRLLDALGIG